VCGEGSSIDLLIGAPRAAPRWQHVSSRGAALEKAINAAATGLYR
jgi:hypothetical protein